MTHAGGRPTKYKEAYITKAREYINECQDEEVEELSGVSAKGTELYRTKLKVNLPTIEGFAVYLGVDKTSLYEWAKKEPKFSHALEIIKSEQQKRLINRGLSWDYNPTIAKLMLSSNHNMREKTEQDVTSNGESIGITGFNFIRADNK